MNTHTDDVPLALGTEHEEQFSEIVHEAGDLHPFGLPITTHGLGGLKQVFDLR